VKFSPASSEIAVAPVAPAAAMRVAEAKSAAKIGSCDGR
jgi:hypothetical protein